MHYGWQLNHGAKLFTWKQYQHKYAFVNGGIRQGAHYRQDWDRSFKCPEYYFKKWVTNYALGPIQAANNFKNDRLYRLDGEYHLVTGNDSHLEFKETIYDLEAEIKGAHCYSLEKYSLPNGTSYKYKNGSHFGMPVQLSLLNREGHEISNVRLEKSPSKNEFIDHPELVYGTSTGKKICYRFEIYGNHDRAILSEVIPPHAPKVKYHYTSFDGHTKQKNPVKKNYHRDAL